MKSSIKVLTEGLTLIVSTEVSELTLDLGISGVCVTGFVTGEGDGGGGGEDPGKNLWSFAKMPLLCFGEELCVVSSADVPSWLE